jgi:hypothetical protein
MLRDGEVIEFNDMGESKAPGAGTDVTLDDLAATVEEEGGHHG